MQPTTKHCSAARNMPLSSKQIFQSDAHWMTRGVLKPAACIQKTISWLWYIYINTCIYINIYIYINIDRYICIAYRYIIYIIIYSIYKKTPKISPWNKKRGFSNKPWWPWLVPRWLPVCCCKQRRRHKHGSVSKPYTPGGHQNSWDLWMWITH
jgi:hypothetical protein